MHIARPFVRTASFTRPDDATQYSVGDGVSDNTTTATSATFTLPSMSPVAAGNGVIHSVLLHKSDQDQTGADFDIYFFDTQPVNTGYEDNAAIAITDAEWKTCLGFVRVVASTDAANVVTGDLYNKTNLDLPYQCAVGSTSLYFVVVARGTYTPANQEVFTLRVGAVVQ
jgi:hypothetical protein